MGRSGSDGSRRSSGSGAKTLLVRCKCGGAGRRASGIRRLRVGPVASYDYLVVGAGFAGSTVAERLAEEGGKRVLVIDRRRHLGGNAYDCLNDAGIRIHRYGPHVFHTNSLKVFRYLSRFTSWRKYEHRVLACVGGQLVPFPINQTTIERVFGLSGDRVQEFLEQQRVVVEHCRSAEDVVLAAAGRELCDMFFRDYSRKQWGRELRDLAPGVTSRIPIRTDTEDRYFTDRYQYMPLDGYGAMFERMLSHRKIAVELGCGFGDLSSSARWGRTVFTGCIDEYFEYRYGALAYRSIEFRFKTVDRAVFQPVAVVNYPGAEEYTRVTEYKHLTAQRHPRTTISYEYPVECERSGTGEPYYPVLTEETAERRGKYLALAAKEPHVHFVGRLGSYRYLNMDQAVSQALVLAERLLNGAE